MSSSPINKQSPNAFVCGLEKEAQRNIAHDSLMENIADFYPMIENEFQLNSLKDCEEQMKNIFSL